MNLNLGTQIAELKKSQIMIIALIFLAVVMILSASLFENVANFVRFGQKSVDGEKAGQLADAGIDYAIWQLNETAGNYNPAPDETILLTVGEITIEVTQISGLLRKITSTGCVPNCDSPQTRRTSTVDALIITDNVVFNYAAQSGQGGVIMNNSTTINGNIFSNGNISVDFGTDQTINGEAYAALTIDSPPILITTGIKKENQDPIDLPTLDYQIWKDAATAGGTIDCNENPEECDISGIPKNIGPKKYKGNLTISNQASVTIDGPIYVTGNVTVRNGDTSVNLNESFGSNGTVFICDGQITVEQGGAFNPTSAANNPRGYILVATSSNSDLAISIANAGANAVFYALDGGAQLSQTAEVNSLVANKLTMNNLATLTYDPDLAVTQLLISPDGLWQVKRGTYRFVK